MVAEGIAALPLSQLQRPVGCDVEEEVGSVRCLQRHHIRICREPHSKVHAERGPDVGQTSGTHFPLRDTGRHALRRAGTCSSMPARLPSAHTLCLLAAPLCTSLPQGRRRVREATDCQTSGGKQPPSLPSTNTLRTLPVPGAILDARDATVAMTDRHGRPGGVAFYWSHRTSW